MTTQTMHTNSEGERIAIEKGNLRGCWVTCLTIFDDAPPRGTGQRAPMLLDAGTREWLREIVAPDLLAACKEMLRVVDEAYEATGFIKVAKTSEQRMRLEAAIAQAERDGKRETAGEPRKERLDPADPASAP